MVGPLWAFFNQSFKMPRPNAPEERDELPPGEIRLSPERIVTPGSKYLNSTELPVDLLNNLCRFRTTDVCVHKLPADQGDDALEVLASDFLTPFFQEPFEGGSLRECSALEVLSSPGEPSSPLTRTLP